jgi:hypothetical protein
MEPDSTRVIVSDGPTAGTSQVHHQDFPEVRADGESPKVAAVHLTHQLARALDSALTNWRREAIQNAINDVEAFTRAGAGSGVKA